MKDVDDIKIENDYVFLNTGSPHHVTMVDDLENYDVKNIEEAIELAQMGKGSLVSSS